MEPDEDPKTTTANKNDNLMLLKEEPMESDPHPPLALPTGVIQQMPVKIPVATAKRSYNKDRHTKVEESQYPPLAPPGSSSSLVNSAINQMGKPSGGFSNMLLLNLKLPVPEPCLLSLYQSVVPSRFPQRLPQTLPIITVIIAK
ncbi:hypothetical protein V6N13_036351 [Hibiscus sabdariffa]